MANKRMFSLSVVDTDLFLEMPITSRLLYYELGMRADDDGFVGNWKKIMRMTGLSEDDMKILITKKFIIPFDSGVIVIRHWRMNNLLRGDRRTPTQYTEELSQLKLNGNVYELESADNTECLPDDNQMTTNGIPTDNQWLPQDRLGKDSIGKDRVVEEEKEEEKKPAAEDPVMKFYLNNINQAITPTEAEDIWYYEEKLPPELIINAMKEAVLHKARNLSYIEKILDRYIQHDITTVAEAQEKKTESEDVWDKFLKGAENDTG